MSDVQNKVKSENQIEMHTYSRKKKTILASLLILFIFSVLSIIGTTIYYNDEPKEFTVPEPNPYFYVSDYSGVLSTQVESTFYYQGQNLYVKDIAQVVVVAIPHTSGAKLQTYANKLINQWNVGVDDTSTGVVILLSTDHGKAWIEVGDGLKEILSDSKCKQLIQDYAKESMQNDNYNQAAFDTWKAVVREIYEQNDLSVPSDILSEMKVPPSKSGTTFADTSLSEEIVSSGKDSENNSILHAFCTFWSKFYIVFILIILIVFVINKGVFNKKSKK